MAGLLNAHLADAIDLFTQAKHAHWNVRGATFLSLHELFDRIAEDVEGYADDLAERAGALDGRAEGLLRTVARTSRLSAYPSEAVDGPQHLRAMASALAAFGSSVRSAIDTAASAGDAGTADLFTEISRGVDKWLWFVESHLRG